MSTNVKSEHERISTLEHAMANLEITLGKIIKRVPGESLGAEWQPLIAHHYTFPGTEVAMQDEKLCTYRDMKYSEGSVICMDDKKLYDCTMGKWIPQKDGQVHKDCPK